MQVKAPLALRIPSVAKEAVMRKGRLLVALAMGTLVGAAADPTPPPPLYTRIATVKEQTAQLTYIPFATDTLTYAFPSGGSVPSNLTDATLKRIYQCDPAITFDPTNPSSNRNGFQPLLPGFGSGNRAFLFRKLGITDSSNYATLHPCVRDTDQSRVPIADNDGRYLVHPKELITYSAGSYVAQILKAQPDNHNNTVLGSINGIGPILDPAAFWSRPVYNVVRTSDISGPTANPAIVNLFVGPNSQVCINTAAIRKAGFGTRPDCGDPSLVSGP